MMNALKKKVNLAKNIKRIENKNSFRYVPHYKIFNNTQEFNIMKTNNQLAERFAEILIRKMEEMKSEKWEKPWFDVSGKDKFLSTKL